MTGFGAASRPWDAPEGPARLDVEVRSVNARFLEVKLRQPFGNRTERVLRQRIEARLGRGRVELAVFVRRAAAGEEDAGALESLGVEPARVREALAAVAQVEKLGAASGIAVAVPSAVDVLRFLQHTARASSEPLEAPEFLPELVDEALEELVSFRRTEGQSLQAALSDLADELEASVGSLAAELPNERVRLTEKLSDRVAELCERLGSSAPEPERIVQEVALLVAKADIEEELARIGSHLGQVRAVLAAEASKGQGKTLDFLSQELLREVTTIGSKITSHTGSRVVIEAKGTIERIREQVQNVE